MESCTCMVSKVPRVPIWLRTHTFTILIRDTENIHTLDYEPSLKRPPLKIPFSKLHFECGLFDIYRSKVKDHIFFSKLHFYLESRNRYW